MTPGQDADPPVVEIVDGLESLPSLRETWDDIFQARPHQPSVSFEWTAAMAAHHVRPDDRCHLAIIRRQGRIDGVVPLVCRRVQVLGAPVRILAPLSEEYNTHSDLLLRQPDQRALGALVGALDGVASAWDCFRMSRLPAESPLALSLIGALAAARRAHHVRDGLAAYALDLPDTFDAYLAQRSAKFRNHLKRIDRKLHDAGPLATHEATTPDGVAEALAAVLQVERASWKQDHGSSIGAVARQQGFYRDFCLDAAQRGRLHLQWLTLNGEPVAHNLGYIAHGTYSYLKTSYTATHRALGPSTWLRARLIQRLIEQGVTRFDFPGEPYEWESQWTDDVRWRRVVTLYAGTFSGRVLHLIDRVRHRRGRARTVEHVDPRSGRLHRAPTA